MIRLDLIFAELTNQINYSANVNLLKSIPLRRIQKLFSLLPVALMEAWVIL